LNYTKGMFRPMLIIEFIILNNQQGIKLSF
jgi:hypothetical protein